MIGDNYLHVQRRRLNFNAESATIRTTGLDLLSGTPCRILQSWLRRAGNQIGKTIKVDSTTIAITRGKFVSVCVEVDLQTPCELDT